MSAERLKLLQDNITDLSPIIDSLEAYMAKHGASEAVSDAKHTLLSSRTRMVNEANAIASEQAASIINGAECARNAIAKKNPGKPPQDINDSMPCPYCKAGTLFYRIAASNGHIGARCNTNKCINFQE